VEQVLRHFQRENRNSNHENSRKDQGIGDVAPGTVHDSDYSATLFIFSAFGAYRGFFFGIRVQSLLKVGSVSKNSKFLGRDCCDWDSAGDGITKAFFAAGLKGLALP
jgi:hypothetical protein